MGGECALGASSGPREWCGLRATWLECAALQGDEVPELVGRERGLGKQVCRIFFAGNLAKFDALGSDGVLDPQGVRFQVAKFAQALSLADANSRR